MKGQFCSGSGFLDRKNNCRNPDGCTCATIARLTAERDEARACLSAAPALWMEKAADACWNKRDLLADAEQKSVASGLTGRDYYGRRLEAELLSRSIRSLIPADSAAALRTLRADAVREAANLKSVVNGITFPPEPNWPDAILALADRIEKGEA